MKEHMQNHKVIEYPSRNHWWDCRNRAVRIPVLVLIQSRQTSQEILKNSISIRLWINVLLQITSSYNINLIDDRPEGRQELLPRPFTIFIVVLVQPKPRIRIEYQGYESSVAKAKPPVRLTCVTRSKSSTRSGR